MSTETYNKCLFSHNYYCNESLHWMSFNYTGYLVSSLNPKKSFLLNMLNEVVAMGMVNKTEEVEMKVGTYPEFSTRIFS